MSHSRQVFLIEQNKIQLVKKLLAETVRNHKQHSNSPSPRLFSHTRRFSFC